MATLENARLNLRTAARNVQASMGLSGASANWSTDQVTAYNKALAAEVLRYPNSFTPEILATAQLLLGRQYTSIEDATFAWGEFGAETLANAPGVLGGFTNKLIIAVVVVAVVYFGVRAYRKGAPASE